MRVQAARRKGMAATVADMLRSLGLVLVVILVVTVIGPARELLWPGDDRPAVQPISYDQYVVAARRFTTVPVWSPVGLGERWRPTSARVSGAGGAPVTLHVGFVTPAGRYAGLEEGVARTFLADRLGEQAARRGALRAVDVAGTVWQLRRTAQGELALTRTAGRMTLVVTGSAALPELRRLAASLRSG